MQWIRAHVAIEAEAPQVMTELVADIFFDLEVKGVVEDDPHLEPVEGWGKDPVPLPKAYGVTGYFPDTPRTAERCRLLEERLAQLKVREGGEFQVTYQRLDEADWAEAWKEFFWPERITSRLVVKPSWRDFDAGENDIVLEIDPGMAFGTGTHPTTALCLKLIETFLTPGDTLLDIGTGSGILLIGAVRLGAKGVCGIDNDEVAVDVARKNLIRNKIDPALFSVAHGDLASAVHQTFDMVVANILSEVILVLLDDIRRVKAPGGLFICSGIIEKNKGKVLAKMADLKFNVIDVAEREEWVAIAAR